MHAIYVGDSKCQPSSSCLTDLLWHFFFFFSRGLSGFGRHLTGLFSLGELADRSRP